MWGNQKVKTKIKKIKNYKKAVEHNPRGYIRHMQYSKQQFSWFFSAVSILIRETSKNGYTFKYNRSGNIFKLQRVQII